MKPTSETRIPALDGLRGVGILMVIVMHAVTGPLRPANAFETGIRDLAEVGWISIDLFFVLSGFLITGILLDTRDHPARWRNFLARRVLRIFPLYYGALFFVFVILPWFWSDPKFTALQSDQVWYWTYTANWLTPITGRPMELFTGHFWSLAIEEQFYLVWPLVVWWCRPRTLFRVAASVMVIGIAFRLWLFLADPLPEAGHYVLTPARLDSLMVGASLAVMARQDGGLARLRPLVPWIGGGSAVAIFLLALVRGGLSHRDAAVSIAAYPLVALMVGALLIAALTGTRVARACEHRALVSLGRYSYGIYVLHLPIIGALQWKGVPVETLPEIIVAGAIAGVLSYGAGWLSYNFYERHFLALKRYFGGTDPRPPMVATTPSVLASSGD